MAILRRPAARVGGEGAPARSGNRVRRPARAEEEANPWDDGEEVALHTVPLDRFKPGLNLVVTQAEYFGGAVKVAGVVERLEVDAVSTFLHVKLVGTTSEAILKLGAGGALRRLRPSSPRDCVSLMSASRARALPDTALPGLGLSFLR